MNVKQSLTHRNCKRLPRRFAPRNDEELIMQRSPKKEARSCDECASFNICFSDNYFLRL